MDLFPSLFSCLLLFTGILSKKLIKCERLQIDEYDVVDGKHGIERQT